MSKLIQLAENLLLDQQDLDATQLDSILGRALGRNIDSADLYLQNLCEESWFLEDGIVKQSDFDIDRGFGLRVVSGEKTGFAYADDITAAALSDAAQSARSIVQGGDQAIVHTPTSRQLPSLYPAIDPITSLMEQEKVDLLYRIDQLARQYDPRVKRVSVSLSASHSTIMLVNHRGERVADVRPMVSLRINVIAEQSGRRERGTSGGGARSGYEFLIQPGLIESYVKKAVEQALTNLQSVPAPAGSMPVVLGPGWPAVLLHEAVGHGLEGDFNRKGSSAFSQCLGEQVASSLCTIVDDGTVPGRRGSLSVDDEGVPGQKTVLIENGILKQYMQDEHNARLMGVESTGNGRRESYADLPLPRMTNTYMLPGDDAPEDIIGSVSRGLYIADMSGGQVDITSGKFVFTASEAYLIEGGKLTQPVKGATLVGNGVEVLTQISMLGNDLELDPGIGVCGKEGQSVPVGVGQPTLKIDKITVGGST